MKEPKNEEIKVADVPVESLIVETKVNLIWAEVTIGRDADTGNTIYTETTYNAPDTWYSTFPEDK